MRRRAALTCGILMLCLAAVIAMAVIRSHRTVETGMGISREGLEKLLQTAQAIDISAYPSDWTDGLEENIGRVSEMLENQNLTAVEIDTAYTRLLDSIQVFSAKNSENTGSN